VTSHVLILEKDNVAPEGWSLL